MSTFGGYVQRSNTVVDVAIEDTLPKVNFKSMSNNTTIKLTQYYNLQCTNDVPPVIKNYKVPRNRETEGEREREGVRSTERAAETEGERGREREGVQEGGVTKGGRKG